MGGRAKPLRLPMKACRLSYAVAGRIPDENVLSDDEPIGFVAEPARLNSGIDRQHEPPGLGADDRQEAGPTLPPGTRPAMALTPALSPQDDRLQPDRL